VCPSGDCHELLSRIPFEGAGAGAGEIAIRVNGAPTRGSSNRSALP
jgi:hypothetical protein